MSWRNIFLAGGALLLLSACDEDNPSMRDYVTVTTSEKEVSFDLYANIEDVQPLEVILQSEREARVMYSWFKVTDNQNDIVCYQGEISGKGELSLPCRFTEEQFASDFPKHTMTTNRYYCRASVLLGDEEETFQSDTIAMHPSLPEGILQVWVYTENGEEPTCEFVDAPAEAMNSFSITNATKIPGRVCLKAHNTVVYDSGDYVVNESGMTFKIRGNTSAALAKKPYKIKLQRKADLLDRGEQYADKDWVLLGSGTDLKTYIGLKVSSYAGFEWVPSMAFCNLIVNDEYRGLYILTEQIERDKNCRISIDKEGYLIEYDAYWWNEELSFENAVYNSKLRWTFKYPAPSEITDEQLAYIRHYIHLCEEAVSLQGEYEKLIDVKSFANWLLVHDVLGFSDGAGSNLYFSKNDMGDSPLKMETPWDFDSMFRNSESWSSIHQRAWFWYPDLLSGINPSFRNVYKQTWWTLCDKISQNLWVDIAKDLNEEELEYSRVLDGKRWDVCNQFLLTEIEETKAWIDRQNAYLSVAIENI